MHADEVWLNELSGCVIGWRTNAEGWAGFRAVAGRSVTYGPARVGRPVLHRARVACKTAFVASHSQLHTLIPTHSLGSAVCSSA
jgi:hypothetical protein